MQEVGKAYQDAVKEVERTVDLIRYTVDEAIHSSGQSLNGENFPGGSRSKLAGCRTSTSWSHSCDFTV